MAQSDQVSLFQLLFPETAREVEATYQATTGLPPGASPASNVVDFSQALARKQAQAPSAADVIDAAAAQTQSAHATLAKSSSTDLIPVLTFPISPLHMAHSAIAAKFNGESGPIYYRQDLLVPAGGTHSVNIPVPEGYRMAAIAPIRIWMRGHPLYLYGSLQADGDFIMQGFPLTHDVDVGFPQYGFLKIGVSATFYNYSGDDQYLTYDFQIVVVREDTYRTVWAPLFLANYQAITNYADRIATLQGGS